MNRRTRHVVVLVIAVVTASIASFGMYRAMAQMPANRVESMKSVVVAARPMVIGTAITAKDVKLVAWPAGSPVPGGHHRSRGRRQSRPHGLGARERAADREQAGAARGGRRPAAGDSARHARHVGEGQRSDRRRRLRRARHAASTSWS